MIRDRLIMFAALSAALAVAMGAFAAHGASDHAAQLLKTGVAYHLPHAAAAITVSRFDRRVSWALLSGGALFGTTLYGLAFDGPPWLGAITPIGGIMLVGGWLWLAVRAR